MTPYRLGLSPQQQSWTDSRLVRYGLVIAVSALLHAGVWRYRDLLGHRPDTPPQPKPPIEVTLTPAPQP
jgi:hypothetical protein